MRHSYEIPMPPKREENILLMKPSAQTNETTLNEFACLACRLGFDSTEIQRLIHRSPDRELARSNLMLARPLDQYEYDPVDFEHFIQKMEGYYSTAKERTRDELGDPDNADWDNLPPPKRCGIPETGRHKKDKSSLYLNNMHTSNENVDTEISSLFVRKSVYLAFFGELSYVPRDMMDASPGAHMQRQTVTQSETQSSVGSTNLRQTIVGNVHAAEGDTAELSRLRAELSRNQQAESLRQAEAEQQRAKFERERVELEQRLGSSQQELEENY